MLLNIKDIRFDSRYHIRELDDTTVEDYANVLSDGITLPKPVVFFDGKFYWMADGRQRSRAHLKSGKADIEVEIKNGTERDAYLHGISANLKHGLRAKNDEKRLAVETMLRDDEWGSWSAMEIARRCGVSHSFVNNVKASLIDVLQKSNNEESLSKLKTLTSDEVVYNDPHKGVSTKKTSAAIRRKRQQATDANPTFNSKALASDYGRLYRQVDALGKIYNSHNTDAANVLRSRLEDWRDDFLNWQQSLQEEKESACASS